MSYGGAWKVGVLVGIVATLISAVLGMIGVVCCLAGFANWAMPTLAGLFAGALAATQADWSEVPPDQANAVGAGLGLRAAAVASVLNGIGLVVISLLSSSLGIVINAFRAGSDDLVPVLIASGVGILIGVGFVAVVAVVSAVVGTALGAGAGAVVASSKVNAA